MEGGGIKLTGRLPQEAVDNTYSIPDLNVGPGFKIRLAMDMVEEMMGEAYTLIETSRQFFWIYHLKGV